MRFCLLVMACLSSLCFSATPEGFGYGYTLPPQINVDENPKISVTFEGQTKPDECTLDTIKKIYFCPDSNTLVMTNYAGFVALKKDKEGIAKLVSPTSVNSNEKVIYTGAVTSSMPSLGVLLVDPNNPSDLSEKLSTEQMAINNFLQDLGNSKEAKKGSEEFEKVAADFYKRKDEITKTVNSIFQEKNYQVELTNGQNINCTRGTARKSEGPNNDFDPFTKQKKNCYSFKCDDVTIDGKSYQTSMILNTKLGNFTNSIHLRNNEGRGPSATVKKIKSPNSSMPLKDYSKFIEAAKLFNSSMKMGMSGYQTLPTALPKDIEEDTELAAFKNFDFMNSLGEAEYSCADNLGTIEKIKLSKYEALEKLANTDFVQLISIINDGQLLGQYIDPNQAARLGCYYGGLYLNEAAAKNLDKIKKNIYPDEQIDKTIDLERATQLFNKAKAMPDIAWSYKPDGCYARAHLMARRFEAEGVRVDKVWIKGNLYVPEENISWNFHVAPIVYVKDKNGNIQKMVIDPSLFDKPVTVEEWDKKMTKQTMKGSQITAFPYPENAANVERAALAFSSSDPYLPGDNISMSEADKIQLANETMFRYNNIGDEPGIYNYPGMQAQ